MTEVIYHIKTRQCVLLSLFYTNKYPLKCIIILVGLAVDLFIILYCLIFGQGFIIICFCHFCVAYFKVVATYNDLFSIICPPIFLSLCHKTCLGYFSKTSGVIPSKHYRNDQYQIKLCISSNHPSIQLLKCDYQQATHVITDCSCSPRWWFDL